jgi:hypothetical protein
MGFFKPDYMSKNQDKALRAVFLESDLTGLAEIMSSAPLDVVRAAAVQKYQTFLADTAVNGPSPRACRDAVNHPFLVNEELLSWIAASTKHPSVGKTALGKIFDQRAIASLASSATDVYVRLAAIEKLADHDLAQRMYAGIVKDNNWVGAVAWEKAWKKLTSQKILSSIATDVSLYTYPRELAINKLESRDLLLMIAESDENNRVRLAAAQKLDDEDLLNRVYIHIAHNSEDADERKTAVSFLTSENSLVAVAKKDRNSDVRTAAVYRLDDKGVLADIARTDRSFNVRFAAAERLGNEDLLAELLKDKCGKNKHDWQRVSSFSEQSGDTHNLYDVYRCKYCKEEKVKYSRSFKD